MNPYSTDYDTVLMEAQEDQHRQARPELSEHIPDMDEYDIILLGYPNWWASIPMPIASFLEEYDFSGKTIIPFNTHMGSGDGGTYRTIRELEPKATVLEGLPVEMKEAEGSASKKVSRWLESVR